MNDRKFPSEDLQRLGAERGPSIDPAFANRLETDLRLAMADRAEARPRPWWQPVLVGLTVVLILVAGGAAIRALSTSPSTELVMSAARDTEVILPDGASADGVPGLELPDGTRISVGADGSAVIDGVVLAPGSTAVVVAGRLELLAPTAPIDSDSADDDSNSDESNSDDSAAEDPTDDDLTGDADEPSPSSGRSTTIAVDEAAGSRSTTTPDRSDETSTSSTTSSGSDRSNPDSDRTDTTGSTTVAPTTAESAPTTAPATTAPATTARSTRPSTSSTSTGRSTTASTRPTSAPEADLSVVLEIEALSDARLRLTWAVAGRGPDVLGYEVQVLSGRRLRTILVLRDGTASTATVELLADQVGYRVRAIGAGGTVLATSRTVAAP